MGQITIRATKDFRVGCYPPTIAVAKGSVREVSEVDWNKGCFWVESSGGSFGSCDQEGWEVLNRTEVLCKKYGI